MQTMQANSHRLNLGKVDYNGSGRKNCKAAITWALEDGRFSMSAEICNPRQTDCYVCGQCVDTVAAFFKSNQKVQRMLVIWREYHLNDMMAGSLAQMAWRADHPKLDYVEACQKLTEAGLNPDPNYIHNGKPYAYGSAWLRREIPAEIIAEIESWSAEG
jgi:hypothetical protein